MIRSTFYTLFTCIVFLSFTANSKNFALGIRGGISIPDLSAGSSNQNPLNTGYSSRLGPDAGIFAEFKFSNLFSLQTMVEYSSQGGKKNGLQAFTTPDAIAAIYPAGQAPQYLYANYNSEANLNYLMISVLGKFGFNLKKSNFLLYTSEGLFLGYLINAKQVTSGASQFFTDPSGQQALPGGQHSFNNTQRIKDQLRNINAGIEGNIGLNYNFGLSDIFIEGGGNYGFLNIQKNSQNGKNNTGAATVAIGDSYWFSK